MDRTPTNNPYNEMYCDACDSEIVDNECLCHNDGGWGWYPFHGNDDSADE